MRTVKIDIEGGVANVTDVPPDVEVIIRDFDVEGFPDGKRVLRDKETGSRYVATVYSADAPEPEPIPTVLPDRQDTDGLRELVGPSGYDLMIPDHEKDGDKYPGNILEGYYSFGALVKLLRLHKENPSAIQFIADMLE